MKRFLTLLLVAGLCLAFLPQAQARPHLPRKAAKGVKAVGGKIVHGGRPSATPGRAPVFV